LTKAKGDRELWIGARALRASIFCCAIALAGCSADDVELNGKIFDAVGLNQKQSTREPKLAERAPLVMPPDLARVPEPGTPPEAVANEVAALQDPDTVAKTSQKELERKQAEYCKVNYELAKAHGDNNADLASGPLGPCKGSVITAIQKWTSDDEEQAEE
jgi:hypothetical protein